MQAQLSIVRPGASDNSEIRLIIRIAMGKTITAVMTPEDFALTATGKSDVPIELKLRNVRIEQEQPAKEIPYTCPSCGEQSYENMGGGSLRCCDCGEYFTKQYGE
jgi:tRNA(Ile2) C34 agmatinyltransferase TiaS